MKNGSIDLVVVQDKDFDIKFRSFGITGGQPASINQIPDIDVYYNSAENDHAAPRIPLCFHYKPVRGAC